ncbi:MAG: TolC family protein [Bacteroidales bacterium]|jgi:outer membrane protein TolC|nr:TolC family protein [Bacteroidales bacterium]
MEQTNGKIKKIVLCAAMFATAMTVRAQILLTMESAMDVAQKNSPTLKTSLLNLESYQQRLIAQRASLKSRFSLNLTPLTYSNNRSFDNRLSQWYTNRQFSTGGSFQVEQPILLTDGVISLVNDFSWQNNQSSLEGGTSNDNQAFSNNLSLRLTQPIFTYNTRKMELQQLEYNLENATISYALQRLNIERQITQQFYSVYTSQSRLDINKEELKNAQQNFDIIKTKVESDLAPKSELFQAELNLSNARSTVEDQTVSLENAKDQLKQTLGMDLDEDIVVTTSVDIQSINIDQNRAIEHGLASRLELRQREIQTKESEFELIRLKDQNKFKGSVSLSVGLTGDDPEFSRIYNKTTPNPRVSVSFTVPIFDWGANKARVRAQEITMEANEINTEQEQVSIELNIRETCRSLVNLKTQIEIAEQSVRNAQLTYDLNLTRYRQGDLTGMEISQFQTQLSNQKISHTQALIQYRIQLLNLKILSLYDFENNVEIVPLNDIENK